MAIIKKQSFIITVFLSVLLLLPITACTQSSEQVQPGAATSAPETNTSTEATNTPSPEPTPVEPAFPVTVTDQAGREVTIEKQPERIVSGYYISTSTLIAMDLAGKLVGIEARAETRPIYQLATPELLQLPNVGTARDFNMEACLALEPDLVVLPIRLSDAADTLADMGVPAILVSPESVDELLDMITLLAAATGISSPADYLYAYLEVSFFDITNSAQQISSRKTVYFTGTSSYLSTAPEGMFQSSLISIAGGINAAGGLDGESRQEVSYEQLLVMNPEYIIIASEAGFDIEDILNDPQLESIHAVIEGQVYKMPAAFEAWDSPVPSSFLGMRWLQCIITDYADPDEQMEKMRESAFDFYNEFYGIEIDTELIN